MTALLMLFASTGTVMQDCPRTSSDERGVEEVGGCGVNLYNFHDPPEVLYETITGSIELRHGLMPWLSTMA